MTRVFVGNRVVPAHRREYFWTIFEVAKPLALHGNSFDPGLATIDVRAAVHATHGIVYTRTTVGRTSAETGDTHAGQAGETFVDVGVAVLTANRVVFLAATQIFGHAEPLACNLGAVGSHDAVDAVALAI